MKKWKKKLRDERGAALVLESAILYPIVFMCIFFLIYMGLYVLQQSALDAYAQKIAILGAREVAYPGYLQLSSEDIYGNGAVEADLGELTTTDEGDKKLHSVSVFCTFDTGDVKTDAYRYWRLTKKTDKRGPMSVNAQQKLVDILEGEDGLVAKYGFFGGKNVKATVECQNYVISQTVTVTITQDLMDLGVLGFFGIEAPQAKAVAKATVGDSDELIRNTDFVLQVVDSLAAKLGINVDSMKSSVTKALQKVGLLDESED